MSNTLLDILRDAQDNILDGFELCDTSDLRLGKEQLSHVITALENGWSIEDKYFPEMLTITRKDFVIQESL